MPSNRNVLDARSRLLLLLFAAQRLLDHHVPVHVQVALLDLTLHVPLANLLESRVSFRERFLEPVCSRASAST